MQIKAPKDFWAGLMFIAFGAGFAIVAQNYPMGTAVRMGPAYFPTILGGILAVLGAILLFRSFGLKGEAIPRLYFRPLIILMTALVLFGFLLRPIGLVAATLALVVVAAFAGEKVKIKQTLLLAVGLATFAVLVFHYGLGLPFKLWPWE